MVVLIVLMYGLLSRALATHFAQVETRDIQREVQQVLAVLDDRRARLDSFASDYAGWDDTYRFVHDLNPAYVESNLPNETFADVELNFILYTRLDGTLVFGRGYDHATERAVPVPTSLRHALVGRTSLVGHTSLESSRTGILALPEGVLLVASRPIITSEKQGPIRGALLMARYLDDRTTKAIARRAATSLTAYRTDAPSLPVDVREARDRLTGDHNLLMRSLSSAMAAGYALLRDVDGNPAMILRVDFPRLYYIQALAGLRRLVALVGVLALLGGLCALLALEQWVLSRLSRLNTAVERIGVEGDLSARVPPDRGRDELSVLTGRINRMLSSLENSRLEQEQSDRRKAAIVEHAQEGICLVDLQTHRIEEANPALHEMLGTAPEGLVGLSVEQAFAGPAVVAWAAHLPLHDEAECVFETRHSRTDGRAIELEISMSLLRESDRQIACAVVRDITERHLAEQERARLEQEFRQGQKLQAVGQLAAGMAHNFNNVLAVIMSTIELVMTEAGETLSARLEVALNSATKAAGMIKQFLVFSRQMPIEKKPVKLPQVIDEVAEMCQRTFDRKIELRVEKRNLPFVLGNQSQIHGVLLNMCINARDALEACDDFGRPLWVDLRADVVKVRGGEVGHPEVTPGEYVRVTIADNGSGMDAATRERIFEPFFTTKEPGKGTGLGLSTAYDVISEHGGWIDCDSQPGVGTTFEVYLPVARDADAREVIRPRPLAGTLDGTETILVVEDEEDLRRMFASLLENHGYRVLQAFDGQDGIATFVSQTRNIDLVLLDLSMPRMSGWEVMGAMRAVIPEVRIILCSGYPVDEGDLNGAQAAVSKPFEAAKLLTTIRRVLDHAEMGPEADGNQAAA
jgi:PAS domain S-box-containing protein